MEAVMGWLYEPVMPDSIMTRGDMLLVAIVAIALVVYAAVLMYQSAHPKMGRYEQELADLDDGLEAGLDLESALRYARQKQRSQ